MSNANEREVCPACGSTMEDAEECQHCDYKRADHIEDRDEALT